MKCLSARRFQCLLSTTLLWVGSIALAYDSHDRPEDRLASEVEQRCETTKEFITTFEYLRQHKELGLDDKIAQSTAHEVAKGCTGAAQRFVKTFELLLKAEAGPRSSLRVAVDLANETDNYADTFTEVFTKSFLAEYLDLDYNTSFDLAKSLSVEYKGNPKIAARDFNELVKFCSEEKNVGLSKPRCGVIAGRIVKKAERFQVRIADEFQKLFRFLTAEEKGPSAPIGLALQIAEDVVSHGPEAPDNFISAYEFSVNKKGLDLAARDSIQFAKSLSQWTYDNVHPQSQDTKIPTTDRTPAANANP